MRRPAARLILKALEAPLFHIAANAGLEGSVIVNKVKESPVGTGFDAYKEEYVDMIEGRHPGSREGYQERAAECDQRCFHPVDNRVGCC